MCINNFFSQALLCMIFLICRADSLYSQPYSRSKPSPPQGEDLYSAIQQIKTGLANTKHLLNNHEAEIRTFENQLSNQENTFEHSQQQLKNEIQVLKDAAKAAKFTFEDRLNSLDQSIKNLETIVRGTVADLRQIATQSNDSVALLAQHEKRVFLLEQQIEKQNQHLQHLETVLQSMMELIQIKEKGRTTLSIQSDGSKTYKVQPGDVLGEIARKQQVSLQALRDANPQVTNDRIIVGQLLNIP